MEKDKMIQLALECGFDSAAVISTEDIIFDPSFRPYCEENLCGQYGANYSCPPACGTPEQMKQKVLSHGSALVLQMMCGIKDFADTETLNNSKKRHNAATFSLFKKISASGHDCFMVGSGGCDLCRECVYIRGENCVYPEYSFSCMSAYCIYVKRLADTCGMEYDYKNGNLPFFSMIVFD